MRRGPVQDRTVPLQRQQTLSTARRHSISELFQLLHDFVREQTKQKKGPKEKDLQRQRLLTPFLFLAVCYESGKPGILNMRDPHNREGRAGLPKGPPLFPVKIDGKEPYQVKAITSLFFYVRKLLFQGGAAR